MILLTDYSAGNDMIVAKPPLRSVEALKGKKVGVELGLVDHLLLETALQKHGLKDGDVTLVNAKTNELPQVLGSSTDIAAVAAWQPNAGEALKRAPGARAIFTSADAPGLIYDAITVAPASLAARRLGQGDQGLVPLRRLHQRSEDAGRRGPDHVRTRRACAGAIPPAAEGDAPARRSRREARVPQGRRADSIYGSTRNANAFNVRNGVQAVAGHRRVYRSAPRDAALTGAGPGFVRRPLARTPPHRGRVNTRPPLAPLCAPTSPRFHAILQRTFPATP